MWDPSLKLEIQLLPEMTTFEQRLVDLEKFDETRRYLETTNKVHKRHFKIQYNKYVRPRVFCEGDLVLVYNQAIDSLGEGKLVSMWHGPYVIKWVLSKGSYELQDYEGNFLKDPINGLYLKRYYA
jgi:hypothetical protein